MKDIVKSGSLYFAVVFAMGFLMGGTRTLWVEPLYGRWLAELLEAPFMLVVTVAAAHLVYMKVLGLSNRALLASGFLGLALMLAAELALVGWLRGISLAQYFADRDPLSGTVYYILLLLFGLMPWMLRKGIVPFMKKGPINTQRLPEVAAMKRDHPKHSDRFSKKRNERLTEEGAIAKHSEQKDGKQKPVTP